MKSIAILLHGVIRLPIQTHLDCIHNIRDQIKKCNEETDITIFYITWANAYDDCPNKPRVETKDRWGDIQDIINNVDFFSAEEVCPSQEDLDSIGFPWAGQLANMAPNNPNRIVRLSYYDMTYHIKKLCDMLQAQPKTFDYVFKCRNDLMVEFDIDEWIHTMEQTAHAYLTPPNFWSRGHGINDHMGAADYETFIKIWRYDNISSRYPALSLFNNESVNQAYVTDASAIHKVLSVSRYVVKRTPGARHGDWVMSNDTMINSE